MEKPVGPNKDHLAAQHGLGRKLLEEGIATPAQLREAFSAASSGGHILQHLVAAGHLTPGALHDFLSKQPGIAGIDITQYNIERGLAQLIPAELARERQVMPIDALGKLLTVAMACPVDTATIADVEALTGRRVKAVLCRTTELMEAIEKQYPDEAEEATTGFENLNLSETSAPRPGGPAKSDMVRKLRALDSLPLSVTALERCSALWGADSPSVVDVCDFVSEQPSLAALALRAANSEAFGLHGQVGSIALACSILGAETVKAIAMDAGRPAGKFDLDVHGRESVLCARACAEVARTCGHTEAGQLYAAGLLHAIGRIALAQVEPEFYNSSHDLESAQLAMQEIKRFGLSFADAGFEVLDAWGIPPDLSGAIRDQLDPASSESYRESSALLACGQSLAAAHLSGTSNPALDTKTKQVFDIAGLEPAMAETILSEIAGAA